MGLLSSIAKIGAKAYKYGKRALNCAPEFVLGESSHVIGKAYKAAPKGSIFSKAKVAGKAFESHVNALKAAKGGFFTRLFKTTVGLPKALTNSTKAGIRLAGMKGTNKFLGALKGLGKGIGKKMPYIGALLTIAFEIPSIIKGYKKEGAKGALKQTAGAGVELGCMAAGAAIGSCICPGLGSAIGGILGAVVGMGVRALTFPEPSDDEEATEDAEQKQQEQSTSETGTDSSSVSEADSSSSSSSSDSSSSSSSDTSASTGTSNGSNPTTSVPYPTTSGMTNPFGAGLSVPNPAMVGMNNPFGMGMTFGTGMMGSMGYMNPTSALVNSILAPGENIFLKYPMGFQFQYMG